MTTVEPDEQGKTARIEQPTPSGSPSAPPAATPPPDAPQTPEARPLEAPLVEEPAPRVIDQSADVILQPSVTRQQEVVFVPLAVNVGDGFKFGCGFFLPMVLAMLIGFVLLAALFVLTSLFGLNLPISR